jgi:2-polyprenyl-3-methyl-5-hydroxy-6-metoxy-1,4-benzoquinol methylase
MSTSRPSMFARPPGAPAYEVNRRGFGTHQALIELVTTASLVLDVGCADGAFGSLLAEQRGATVVGVEVDAQTAESARSALPHVVAGDVSDPRTLDAVRAHGPYDHVVLGDVLEHTTEPDTVLRLLATTLRPGGTAVVSLPNILAVRPRARMVAGRWRYEDSGPFDRTHLRFFSIAGSRELVASAGMTISREIFVGPLSHRLGRPGERLTRIRPGLLANHIVFAAAPAPAR